MGWPFWNSNSHVIETMETVSLQTSIYSSSKIRRPSNPPGTVFCPKEHKATLGWAWVSPTLPGLHCACVCVYVLICLLVAIYRKFELSAFKFTKIKPVCMHSIGYELSPGYCIGNSEQRPLKLKHACQLSSALCCYGSSTAGCSQVVQI